MEATKQSIPYFENSLDCFAEPVIGRAFSRPVGSQWAAGVLVIARSKKAAFSHRRSMKRDHGRRRMSSRPTRDAEFGGVTDITVSPMPLGQCQGIRNGPAEPGQWEPTMTAFFSSTLRRAGLVAAFAVSFSALSSSASFAFSAEAQQMCTSDAFRLCSSDIPNIPAITACMHKHRADLSSGCRTVMDRDLAAQRSTVAAK